MRRIDTRTSFVQVFNKSQSHLLIILVLALILRIAAAVFLGNTVSGLSGAHDEISYSMLGHRFATDHGMTFPENWYPWIRANSAQSYYSYTMSLILAGIYSVFGYYPIVARLFMALLSTLVVWLIFRLAKYHFNSTIAVISGLIAASYAYLIFYGVTLVTETPFLLAVLIALNVAIELKRKSNVVLWMSLGIALALAMLLRMAIIFFGLILLVILAFGVRKQRRAHLVLIPILLIILAVLPFTIRNYRLWGKFMLLESQFGHVFWNGNHPDHQGNFHPYKVFPIPPEILKTNNDAEITTDLLWMGVENVLNDPKHFLLLTFTRLRELFTFWPTPDSTLQANALRVLSAGAVLPLAVIGLILNLSRWRSLGIIYLFLIVNIGVYAISWTMIRYRIPSDAFFIMFASYTIYEGYKLLRNRMSGRRDGVFKSHLST